MSAETAASIKITAAQRRLEGDDHSNGYDHNRNGLAATSWLRRRLLWLGGDNHGSDYDHDYGATYAS